MILARHHDIGRMSTAVIDALWKVMASMGDNTASEDA